MFYNKARPKLSRTTTGQQWLAQFKSEDQRTAAAMLDSLLLLNAEEVSVALRALLQDIAVVRTGRRKSVALYAEREFDGRQAFEVQRIPDSMGVIRDRAVGKRGPPAVNPVRGSSRVGSEGLIAFVISQVVKEWPNIFSNHPGPDRIRNKRAPISTLAIVTDFIGSGTRVCSMLDKFGNVPSVRAWVSRKWVRFVVVAAAGTSKGIEKVQRHRLMPRVAVKHISPTLLTIVDEELQRRCEELLRTYGPDSTGAVNREGFDNTLALIAFSYGIPNNTPLLLHKSAGGWRALYNGAAPEALRDAFGVEETLERIKNMATAIGVDLAQNLSIPDAQTIVVLKAICGRWCEGADIALAETTGLPVTEIIAIRRRATKSGLLNSDGRITDNGHAFLRAGTQSERKRPTIPTSSESYYPASLRVPRAQSRIRRPSGRP